MSGETTLAVHRCRFVDFTPAAITALAFPPLPLPSLKGKETARRKGQNQAIKFGTLAVGRANGNIELCEWTGTDGQVQAPQAWVVRKILVGPSPSKVDSLAFTIRHPDKFPADDVPSLSDLRLFSSGGGSELIEWDIDRGCVRRTINSQGGSIWCIAPNPASSFLALGCEDGSVRLLSLVMDTLTHHRRFDRVKYRLLSIAWGPPVPRQQGQVKQNEGTKNAADDSDADSDEDEDDWSDSWLVTGCSDSCIRKWDFTSGRVLERMNTDKVRGERTLVWAVGVLGDGTIVSGDSLGSVKFWDSKTSTQLQTFPAHGADVLCLAIGSEGNTVYSSGVDQKVIQFSYMPAASAPSSTSQRRSSGKWIQACGRRIHSHDVRSLAIWPPYTALPLSYQRTSYVGEGIAAPVLASGGLDMSVILTSALLSRTTATSNAARTVNPLATSTAPTFEDSYHRKVAYPASVCVSRQSRLVACMRDTGVTIWRILTASDDMIGEDSMNDGVEEKGGWEKVLEMELNVRTNLVTCALSDDGRWFAVSDLYETKLFALVTSPSKDVKLKRVKQFTSILQASLPVSDDEQKSKTGASALAFSPDSSKLIIATTSTSHVVVVDLSSDELAVLRSFDQHRKKANLVGGRVVRGMSRAGHMMNGFDDENEEGGIFAQVRRMAVSPDGQWLATSDDLCRTFIFNLDSLQLHTNLPSLPLPPVVLAFPPGNPHILLSALPNNTIHLTDVEHGEIPPWARKLCGSIPKRFKALHDAVLGVTFDFNQNPSTLESTSDSIDATASEGERQRKIQESISRGRVAFFWGSTWICKVSLDEPVGWSGFKKRQFGQAVPIPSEAQSADGPGAPPSHLANSSVSITNFKMVTHYRPILAVDFVGHGEMVIVERPLVDVMAKLPPAYFKPKYGRT